MDASWEQRARDALDAMTAGDRPIQRPTDRAGLDAIRARFARNAVTLRALAHEGEGETYSQWSLATPAGLVNRAKQYEVNAAPPAPGCLTSIRDYPHSPSSWVDGNDCLWSERPKPEPVKYTWWDRVSEALVGPLVFLMFAADALLIIFVGVSCDGPIDYGDPDSGGGGRYDDVGGGGRYDDGG